MVIVSGTPWRRIACFRKRSAASCIPVFREQKVNGLAVFIHGAIQVAPLAFDADVGLVHAPAAPHRPLAEVEHGFQLRAILQDPAVVCPENLKLFINLTFFDFVLMLG